MNFFITAAFIAFATPVLADFKQDFCSSTAKLGITVMTARQVGISLEQVLSNAAAIKNNTANSLYQAIITDAYSTPIYTTAEAKQLAILSFGDQINRTCNNTLE